MARSTFRPTGLLLLGLLLLVEASAPQAANPAQPPASTRELVLLNWAEYMDPELLARFQKRYNTRVKEVYFESDDVRDSILAEADGRGFDLAVVNGLRLNLYRKRGWLAPLSETEIPNLALIDPKWLDAFGARGYAVPYFWGTLGIGYRRDLVPQALHSWRQLFEPTEPLRGRIAMVRTSRDLVGMALKALGHSANSTDRAELAAAERLLLAQRPHVQTYTYVDVDDDSPLVTGKVVAAMMYSGDALMSRERNENISYVLPAEGGNIWMDYLVVLRNGPNPALAHTFIDFLNEPENAAQLARYVHYATPNKAAERLLPEEFLVDPVIYPDEEDLTRSEFYLDLPPRIIKSYNRIFDQVVN